MTLDADVSELTHAYPPRRARPPRALLAGILTALASLCNPVAAIELSSLEWPPYSGAELPGQGALPQLLRQALSSQNESLLIRFQPWNRAIKSASEDPFVVGYFPEYKAENLPCLYSDSIGTSRLGLAHRSDLTFSWQQLDELARYRIGVVNGYRNSPEFDALVATGKLKVEAAVSDELNLLKLLYGRLDLVVIDEQVMQYWLQQEPLLRNDAARLTFAPQLLGELSMHVCFAPGDAGEQARQLLNRGLHQIDR